MQIFESLRREGARLRRGIVIEHGRARHVALLEAHALAVLQVDGGKQDHGLHFRKLAISASPKRWLFSGWNCVPIAVSLADDGRDRPAIFGARQHIRLVRRR